MKEKDLNNNFNQLNFDNLKPYQTYFSLENHFQPFYDDRRDFNTNAPSYYDFLASYNHQLHLMTWLLNRVARRNIEVEDTPSIDFTKINDWIDNGTCPTSYSDIIKLRSDVKISNQTESVTVGTLKSETLEVGNSTKIKDDGVFTPNLQGFISNNHDNIVKLDNKLDKEINDRKEADKQLENKIDTTKEELNRKIENINSNGAIPDIIVYVESLPEISLADLKHVYGYDNSYYVLNKDRTEFIKLTVNTASNNLTQEQITKINEVDNLKSALQKIIDNLFNFSNIITSNDLNNFTFNEGDAIAGGNLNIKSKFNTENSLRTHKNEIDNDLYFKLKEEL